jgi:cytochrome c553
MLRALVLLLTLPTITLAAPVGPEPLDPKPPVEQPAEAPVLDALPLTVRALLKPRMNRHGRDQSSLHIKVKQGDWRAVALSADNIASELNIAPPVPGQEDTLNSQLPPRFFALQRALRTHAKALREAAQAGQRYRVERAFDALTLTCVQCHGHFGPPPHAPLPNTLPQTPETPP